MSVHIALLRALNVGGHNMVAMADLLDFFETAGFPEARSLLQSGNVVFRSGKKTGAALENLLETESQKRLDLGVDYIVRTAVEWTEVVSRNPLPRQAKTDPSRLLVMFLKNKPSEKGVKALQAAAAGPEIVRANGRHVYLAYPAGVGQSKLTTARIEAALGTRGTCRNWNTILKLAALAESPGGARP